MANIGSLIRSPEELQSSRTGKSYPGGIEEHRALLLELRTEAGAVYVCPSRWERIRLLWTFRHFHVLPPQVLSRHDRRLIERLSRSALVTPSLPVARNTVFGVVEKARSKPPASVGRDLAAGKGSAGPQAFLADPEISGAPRPGLAATERLFLEKSSLRHLLTAQNFGYISKQGKQKEARGGREARVAREARLQQWGALGVLAAVCIVVVLARVNGISLLPSTAQVRNPQAPPTPITEQAAKDIATRGFPLLAASPIRVSAPIVPVAIVERPKHRVTLSPLGPSLAAQRLSPPLGRSEPARPSRSAAATIEPAALTPNQPVDSSPSESLLPVEGSSGPLDASGWNLTASGSGATVAGPAAIPSPSPSTSKRLFVSELPQGHFVYPVLSDPNLVGDLRLRALIGADGSVEDVTVLSGDPKLAEAGMRAVRHWRYSPYQALGHPVAVETQIKMSFFGEDAVSITSVANISVSELR